MTIAQESVVVARIASVAALEEGDVEERGVSVAEFEDKHLIVRYITCADR